MNCELKKHILALWHDIDDKRIMGTAVNLTYSTLLAFVPIMAVVFAIARGFGYSMYIEDWFRESLASQPDAANTIIGFVNSYLVHTKKGVFLGIGLLFMLFTVLMLISNIELAFNDIWQVKRQRSVFRTVTDYITLLFFVPIVIVISSGLSIVVATINHHLSNVTVIGSLMSFIIEFTPYLLWSVAFTALYVFMLQTSWIICLAGAELSYCRQNSDDFFANSFQELSFQEKEEFSWEIIQLISQNFREGNTPFTDIEIKKRLKRPMRVVKQLLYDLQRINYITELTYDEKGETPHYLPVQDIDNFTQSDMRDKLATLRPEK